METILFSLTLKPVLFFAIIYIIFVLSFFVFLANDFFGCSIDTYGIGIIIGAVVLALLLFFDIDRYIITFTFSIM